MLNLKKAIAILIVATFLASIPLTISSAQSDLIQVDYTIKVGEYNAKPSGTPGKPTAEYKILLNRYITITPVVLTVYTTNTEGIAPETFAPAIGLAAETWDEATTVELANDVINTVSDEAGQLLANNVNAVFFADLDSSTIAVASVWYNRFTRKIVECDIRFNTDFDWGNAEIETSPVMDLQNIATHELGHFFNLADIYDSTKSYLTMYGSSYEGDIEKRTLADGDKAGIVAVFGP